MNSAADILARWRAHRAEPVASVASDARATGNAEKPEKEGLVASVASVASANGTGGAGDTPEVPHWAPAMAARIAAVLAEGAEREADANGFLILVRPDGRRHVTVPAALSVLEAAGLLPALPPALAVAEAAARARPVSWAEAADLPREGDRCPRGHGHWWTERAAALGWRCAACHPPVHLGEGEWRELKT